MKRSETTEQIGLINWARANEVMFQNYDFFTTYRTKGSGQMGRY